MTWRPRRGRLVPMALAVTVAAVCVGLAILVPPSFGVSDRAGFVLLGLFLAGGLLLLGRCRLGADERGLSVVNIVRRRELEWAEIVDVTMAVGEPWPTLDLADGTTLAVMGIQAADGRRARTALAELQALVRERAEGAEPDA